MPTDQVNLTDEESRITPAAGGGFEPCCNAQAAVAAGSQLVVATGAVQAPNDKNQVEPMLEKIGALPEGLGRPENLLADTGYFSAGNAEACQTFAQVHGRAQSTKLLIHFTFISSRAIVFRCGEEFAAVIERTWQMFRKFVLSFAFLAATALPFANSAEAAIGDGVVAGHLQMQAPIEDAAYVYGGYSYCWYSAGWRGPVGTLRALPCAPAWVGAEPSVGMVGAAVFTLAVITGPGIAAASVSAIIMEAFIAAALG